MTEIAKNSSAETPFDPALMNRGAADAERAFSSSLLSALLRFKDGDFTSHLPSDLPGIDGKIADVFNVVLAVNSRRASEIARICRVVGKEGKLKQRMNVPGAVGGWAEEVASSQHAHRRPGAAHDRGDARPSARWPRATSGSRWRWRSTGGRSKGEFLRSAKLVNTMIEQLSVFTSEVTRVAREVGTEGKLGGQAQVKGVSGVWKDLTDIGQPDGRQPDRAGAQHRRRDHRGGQRRSLQEDHRRRARRDSAAQGSHQHDGRPAALVRVAK